MSFPSKSRSYSVSDGEVALLKLSNAFRSEMSKEEDNGHMVLSGGTFATISLDSKYCSCFGFPE
jgi:hypothetical protein